jgi:hypothetical protein
MCDRQCEAIQVKEQKKGSALLLTNLGKVHLPWRYPVLHPMRVACPAKVVGECAHWCPAESTAAVSLLGRSLASVRLHRGAHISPACCRRTHQSDRPSEAPNLQVFWALPTVETNVIAREALFADDLDCTKPFQTDPIPGFSCRCKVVATAVRERAHCWSGRAKGGRRWQATK